MQTTNTTKATKVAPVPNAPVSLLATLQAAAPVTATNAQLSALVAQITGTVYAPVQNAIAAPIRGSACLAVWVAFCNYLLQNKTVPTLVQLAPQLTGVNPTTQAVQFYKVRKYFGL